MLIPPNAFKVCRCCSKDLSRYQLCGVHVVRTPAGHAEDEYPTNGTDVSHVDGFSAIIPTASAVKMSKWKHPYNQMLDNVLLDEHKTETTVSLSTTDLDTTDVHKPKLIDAEYPDFSSVLGQKRDDVETLIDVDTTIQALQTIVDVLGKGQRATMCTDVAADKAVIYRADDADSGIKCTTLAMPWVENK